MQGFLIRSLAVGLLVCVGANAAPVAKRKVLFAVFGGYTSCDKSDRSDALAAGVPISYSYRTLEKNIRTKQTEVEFLSIFGCLFSEAPPNGEGEFVLSSQPSASRSGSTKDILWEIESLVKKDPNLSLYLVGHSYGGWMAMYLAQELKNLTNLKGLFTIDPIGPACDSIGFVLGDSNCHRAPEDLNNKQIRKNVGEWVNFYQTEDSWLTSSSIKEAQNHHITFSWGPHGDMDTDNGIWKLIEKSVQKSF